MWVYNVYASVNKVHFMAHYCCLVLPAVPPPSPHLPEGFTCGTCSVIRP